MAGLAKRLGEMAFNSSGGAINWFPGHMAAATRAIRERLKLADLVVEVRDARLSFFCCLWLPLGTSYLFFYIVSSFMSGCTKSKVSMETIINNIIGFDIVPSWFSYAQTDPNQEQLIVCIRQYYMGLSYRSVESNNLPCQLGNKIIFYIAGKH
eukprot:Gb_15547 [translate_table: standard]